MVSKTKLLKNSASLIERRLYFYAGFNEQETSQFQKQPCLIPCWRNLQIFGSVSCRNVPVLSVLSGSMRIPLQLGATDPPAAAAHCPMSDSNYSTFRSKRWRSNGHDGASTGTRGVSWHPEIVGSSGGRSNRVQTWIWSNIYDTEQEKHVFVHAFLRIGNITDVI